MKRSHKKYMDWFLNAGQLLHSICPVILFLNTTSTQIENLKEKKKAFYSWVSLKYLWLYIYFLTLMFLNQSHSTLAVCGHRLLEEKPVQADGWTSRSSWDRHCGREHPHPSGQGQKHGECTHSMSRGVVGKLSGSPYQRVWTPIRTVGPGLLQSGLSGDIRKKTDS